MSHANMPLDRLDRFLLLRKLGLCVLTRNEHLQSKQALHSLRSVQVGLRF